MRPCASSLCGCAPIEISVRRSGSSSDDPEMRALCRFILERNTTNVMPFVRPRKKRYYTRCTWKFWSPFVFAVVVIQPHARYRSKIVIIVWKPRALLGLNYPTSGHGYARTEMLPMPSSVMVEFMVRFALRPLRGINAVVGFRDWLIVRLVEQLSAI